MDTRENPFILIFNTFSLSFHFLSYDFHIIFGLSSAREQTKKYIGTMQQYSYIKYIKIKIQDKQLRDTHKLGYLPTLRRNRCPTLVPTLIKGEGSQIDCIFYVSELCIDRYRFYFITDLYFI